MEHETVIAEGSRSREVSTPQLHAYLRQLAAEWIVAPGVRRLLLLPPDSTRRHSLAGTITAWFYQHFEGPVHVDVMPTLGTHRAMTAEECQLMFAHQVPYARIIPHRWRHDLETLGEIDAAEISRLSQHRFAQPLRVEVNRRIVSGQYDLILSIGQVVPHEVTGFANYTKNVCVGAGGRDVIDKSHFLGAICNMESIMGRCDTPVRRLVDTAFDRFIKPRANINFILTVLEDTPALPVLRGLYAGSQAELFRQACDLSRDVNCHIVDEPLDRCVVWLDPTEFKSTWLGNKAIYRTRMAMADGGQLIVLAPGVDRFGEDPQIDRLIRSHGYHGTERTLEAVTEDPRLADNLSAAAHLIHGSSEGRFSITYAPGPRLSADAVRQAGYHYADYQQWAQQADWQQLSEGWHTDKQGRRFYFIRNPALGLWSTRAKLDIGPDLVDQDEVGTDGVETERS